MAAAHQGRIPSAVNLAYMPRLSVPNADAYLRAAASRSARARRRFQCTLDVPYGSSAGERLDIFPARHKSSPVHVFIHGGYWRALDKHYYSFVAPPLVAAGATVVLPNYDLCPRVGIEDIVDQMRRALVWIYRNIRKHGGDPTRIFVSGHSAGGHLTAMMLATPWAKHGLPRDFIKGAACLSGVFDIRPLRRSQLQPDIRLTATKARALSPMLLPPVSNCSVLLAVGELESHQFHWQSLAFGAHLRKHGVASAYLSTSHDNHFSIVDRLQSRHHPLSRLLTDQMGL